jgi:hypothetical protein
LSLYQHNFAPSSMATGASDQSTDRIKGSFIHRRHTSQNVNTGRSLLGRHMLHFSITSPSLRFSSWFDHVLPKLARSTSRYPEFRAKTDATVCCYGRNASRSGWRLRQQRAERAGVPLQRRIRVPIKNGWNYRLFRSVLSDLSSRVDSR